MTVTESSCIYLGAFLDTMVLIGAEPAGTFFLNYMQERLNGQFNTK